jgi:stringent starvation protein B
MTPNSPYLIRGLYEWILDNRMTPHLLVNANHPKAQVPAGFVQDGRIVLNICPTAVQGLVLGNERIAFSARFGGVATEVAFPPQAVLGIYARENGRGMLFPEGEADGDADTDGSDAGGEPEPPTPPRVRPSLKVVK